jgi:hypothetical protein
LGQPEHLAGDRAVVTAVDGAEAAEHSSSWGLSVGRPRQPPRSSDRAEARKRPGSCRAVGRREGVDRSSPLRRSTAPRTGVAPTCRPRGLDGSTHEPRRPKPTRDEGFAVEPSGNAVAVSRTLTAPKCARGRDGHGAGTMNASDRARAPSGPKPGRSGEHVARPSGDPGDRSRSPSPHRGATGGGRADPRTSPGTSEASPARRLQAEACGRRVEGAAEPSGDPGTGAVRRDRTGVRTRADGRTRGPVTSPRWHRRRAWRRPEPAFNAVEGATEPSGDPGDRTSHRGRTEARRWRGDRTPEPVGRPRRQLRTLVTGRNPQRTRGGCRRTVRRPAGRGRSPAPHRSEAPAAGWTRGRSSTPEATPRARHRPKPAQGTWRRPPDRRATRRRRPRAAVAPKHDVG